jgi:DNA repair protein RadC
VNLNFVAIRDRPRERLLEKGSEALSDAELLAIILRTGTKKDNALVFAQNILNQQSLVNLSRMSASSLSQIYGIGQVKACQIVSCFELARRLLSGESKNRQQINSASDVASYYIPKLSFMKKECLVAIYLDARRRRIKDEIIATGSIDAAVISPKEIFHHAIVEKASAVILVHNHPSGDSSPSEEDITVTNELAIAGNLLGIQVLDHVVVSDNGFTSMREKDLLKK